MTRLRALVFAIALAVAGVSGPFSGPAEAGSDARPRDAFTLQQAAEFSKMIERDLGARGARVALVFRSGRPREDLPEGVRYTHAGFWVYTPIQTATGETIYGYAVYNLYHDAVDRQISYLAQDWPLDFTRGDVTGEIGVIVPNAEMQARIINLIASNDYQALHQPNYSLVSNPADLRYQNCTEFMLDVVAASAWNTSFRPQLKANLRAYFTPTEIRSNPVERFFARFSDDRLRLDDHRGGIRTATYQSIAQFMLDYDLADEAYELRSPFEPRPVRAADYD